MEDTRFNKAEAFHEKVIDNTETIAAIREWVDIMKDEPEEWIKLSEVYHSLRRMLGDE